MLNIHADGAMQIQYTHTFTVSTVMSELAAVRQGRSQLQAERNAFVAAALITAGVRAAQQAYSQCPTGLALANCQGLLCQYTSPRPAPQSSDFGVKCALTSILLQQETNQTEVQAG